MQNPNDNAQEVQPDIENATSEDIAVEAEIVAEDSQTDTAGELAEAKDKYLRLFAEFENFRRRTAKEKTDLIKNAGEDIIKAMLPIIDDFERAQKAFDKSSDLATLSEEAQKEIIALKEGVTLIQHKLLRSLEQKGLKVMESSVGKTFDVNEQESITNIPAPSDDMRGKVIDEVERGYYLNDKILRFAKVVVGS
ncbi:MAG: nucleotide exchange factor GrpE [Bacteroidetes bacterium]|nr:MAG: nucleotide exchange factor GrpE [Bacteroidota bacterium]